MNADRLGSSSFAGSSSSSPRGLLVAGAGSGSGKTLATLALLAGLKARGLDVLPYKCGPDFIDPRHHERVALTPSRNLDLHFTPPDRLRKDFDRELSGRSGAVVEGVMGLFDGLAGGRSTFDLARVLGLPVVLVLSARGMAETAAALVRGLVFFREGVSFAGVIATRTGSSRHGEMIARALEKEGLPPLLGVLPRDAHLELPERYLGLSAPGEEGEEKEGLFLERLREHAQGFRWEKILPLFSLPPSDRSAPSSPDTLSGTHILSPPLSESISWSQEGAGRESRREKGEGEGSSLRGPWGAFFSSLRDRALSGPPGESEREPSFPPSEEGRGEGPGRGEGLVGARGGGVPRPPRLAVALDRAFWFYYHENWEELRRAGIELAFFSPLEDGRLPAGSSGLYFGGGYPERFARKLSENRSMVEAVRDFCRAGRPVYAECGGMLYLTRGPQEDSLPEKDGEGRGISRAAGESRPADSPRDFGGELVGILPVRYRMGERLRRLGYSEVEAASGLFAGVPGSLRGHLFHYTDLVDDLTGEGRGPQDLPGRREGSGGGDRENGGGGHDTTGTPANSPPEILPDRPVPRPEPAFRHTADGRPEGFARGGVVASYMHAFFPTNPLFAARLAERLRS